MAILEHVALTPEQLRRKVGPDSQHAIKARSDHFITKYADLTGYEKYPGEKEKPGIIRRRAEAIISGALKEKKDTSLPPLSTLNDEQRAKIIQATTDNMRQFLYDEAGHRVTHTKNYVTEHLEQISANIYAATVATLGFDEVRSVQLLAELAMFEGYFVQLRTGEGKTVCNGGAAILYAIMGEGVHVVTPNQYLAEEGAKRIGKVAGALGLEVGLIFETSQDNTERNPDGSEKQVQFAYNTQEGRFKTLNKRSEAYMLDITYGTDDEFQFDFIKDRTVLNPDQYRQVRGQKYAVIDELDQILLDKATSDHIISNPYSRQEVIKIGNGTYTEQELSALFAVIVDQLEEGKDYTVDESTGQIDLYDAEAEAIKYAKKIDDQIPWWLVKLIGKEPPPDVSDAPDQGWTKVEALMRRPNLIEGQTEPLLGEGERFQGNIPEQTGGMGEDLLIYLLNAIRAKSMEKPEESHTLEIDSATSIGEIDLESPFTRRIMKYSRYTEGLHQALEARQQLLAFKNGTGVMIPIQADQGVLTATATSSYFKRYDEITGSSGSLIVRENPDNPEQLDYTPAAELYLTYSKKGDRKKKLEDRKKEIIEIPSHTDPNLTINPELRVYPSVEEKLLAIALEIGVRYGYNKDSSDESQQVHERVRPILIGLYDRSQMEQLRDILNESLIPFFNKQHPDFPIHIQLLSAEDTQEEGRIIANAGIPNTITIASIAGRGTDIVLGGERPQDLALLGERPFADRRPQTPEEWQRLHDEAVALGGLYAIGEPGVNQRISIQFAGRPREIGEWWEVASCEDYFLRKAYGPKGAEALAKAAPDLAYDAIASSNIIDKAQTINSNNDARLRMDTLRDHETIDAQFDAFYRDRTTIVETDNMRQVVHDLARTYIRSLLIGSSFSSDSALFSPLEKDTSVSQDYMTDEEVTAFTGKLFSTLSVTKESIKIHESDGTFVHDILSLARNSTKRALIDLATEKVMDRLDIVSAQQDLIQTTAANETLKYVQAIDIPEDLRSKMSTCIVEMARDGQLPSFDDFAQQKALTTADAHMGDHYTQLLSLRTSIMRIRATQDRFPADTFRREASQLYRGFKQRMQETILKTIFSTANYTNYVAAQTLEQATKMAKQALESEQQHE